MGRKSRAKDRAYLTTKEWKEEWGGFKAPKNALHEHLPFYCCALAFTNFEDPVCTEDGSVFDVSNIVPYVLKHGTHPVTGQPLQLDALVALNFHKNADGQFECPVLKKVFTQHSHIVAIKPSGNVYAYETIQKFNIKLKAWNDLLTNEPFTKSDIIHIQDPTTQTTPADFDHVKRDLTADEADESVIRNANATMQKVMSNLSAAPAGGNVQEPSSRRALAMAQLEAAIREKKLAKSKTAAHQTKGGAGSAGDGATAAAAQEQTDADAGDWRLRGPAPKPVSAAYKPGTSTWDTDDAKEAQRKVGKRALAEQKQAAKAEQEARRGRVVPAEWWHANYRPQYEESIETVGHAARSLTSTTAQVVTRNERVRKLVHRDPKDKGYVALTTSKGTLNIELHCDIAPRTCENFLALCEMGYYTGTCFHRSIRNFMVQGGDPTGSGTGGESIYGATFRDELDSRLVHDRRGVLAMANSGKDTNGSQFYVLYKSARHLDYKHSVFGAVVGGLDVLSAIEAVKTDDEDRPRERIVVTGCVVHRNPFRDMIEAEDKAEAQKREAQKVDAQGVVPDAQRQGQWFSNPQQGVSSLAASAKRKAEGQATIQMESKKGKQDVDDFDAW